MKRYLFSIIYIYIYICVCVCVCVCACVIFIIYNINTAIHHGYIQFYSARQLYKFTCRDARVVPTLQFCIVFHKKNIECLGLSFLFCCSNHHMGKISHVHSHSFLNKFLLKLFRKWRL